MYMSSFLSDSLKGFIKSSNKSLAPNPSVPEKPGAHDPNHPGHEMEHINQELYKRNAELAVRNKTLALLRRLDEISLSEVDIKEMAERITSATAEALGYELVSIALVNEKKNILQWLAISSATPWVIETMSEILVDNVKAKLDDKLSSVEVLHGGATKFVAGLEKIYPKLVVDALMHLPESYEGHQIKHTMLYPLKFGGRTLGLLTLSTNRSLDRLSQYEHESVTGIVGMVALALYKGKIYQDLQETSAELADANKKLQDLDKVKSEFLSIASHQLYTPLTALRGYVSMLNEGDFGKVPKQQKDVLSILDQSAVKLIDLIKGLLDISRIERGKLELNLESIDLSQMARELVRDLLPNAENKDLKLAFHEPEKALPHVVVDQQRIRQVMLNFIDNSIKYTNKGSIDVSVKQDNDKIIFSVTDTGKGLTQDEIKILFTKFTRVGGAARFNTQGSGLGLYVAKQIVQEHQGDVAVTSPGLDKGSTFSVELPIEGSAEALKVGQHTTVDIKAAETK